MDISQTTTESVVKELPNPGREMKLWAGIICNSICMSLHMMR